MKPHSPEQELRSKETARQEVRAAAERAMEAELKGDEALQEKLMNFVHALEQKYSKPVCQQYELYHVLIGSSPIEPIEFDFRGKDSILAFAQKLK